MEISQQTVTIETTDKTIESEKNATNPTITIQSDNNYLETPAQLIHSKSQENEQKPHDYSANHTPNQYLFLI